MLLHNVMLISDHCKKHLFPLDKTLCSLALNGIYQSFSCLDNLFSVDIFKNIQLVGIVSAASHQKSDGSSCGSKSQSTTL